MNMSFRWFGEGNDTVTLEQVRQIPGVTQIVWSLHDLQAGEEWPLERIAAVRDQVHAAGLGIEVVESVNVHEDIKLGAPGRDMYIERYKNTIRHLASVGVKVICYNFMPVFDWIRTDLHKQAADGSTAMFYEQRMIADINPDGMAARIHNGKFTMPGWEPERLARLPELLAAYRDVTEDMLWDNLGYFLQHIVPVAESCGIQMAIHPDDPPWPVFGLPRIITGADGLRRLLKLYDSPSNGITLCSGSLGANPDNDIAAMIREFAGRIPFAHIRNVRVYDNGDFIETSHRTTDGTVDIAGIVQAFSDIGYSGYARPDHGRQIWNEQCRPGYGLYDRALGIMYLWGLWDGAKQTAASHKKEAHQ